MAEILESKHCEGKLARIIIEDHTGAVQAKCDCGVEYNHSKGAYWGMHYQNLTQKEIRGLNKLFAEEGG